MCNLVVKSKPPAKRGIDGVVHRIPQWENFDEKPELQTLRGQILRRATLFTVYFTWVCLLVAFLTMGVFAGLLFVLALVKRDLSIVPDFARWFVVAMALWTSYHFVMPANQTWPLLCRLYRDTLTKYPYFRYNRCVFEGDEEAVDGAAPAACDSTQPQLVPADARAMFAFHPHGILSCGFSVNGVHHTRFAQSKTRWLVSENMFWFPALRELLSWLDCGTVEKKTFTKLMRAGTNVGFFPGGFEEATIYQRGRFRVFIKNRFGFIKLALQHGYKVYPAFTFGEEQTFHSFTYLEQFRLKLNEWRIPGAFFFGDTYLPFMPRSDLDLITVFGRPLQFPTIANPSAEDVQTHQQLYINALQGVFDRNKSKYAVDPNAVLEIL